MRNVSGMDSSSHGDMKEKEIATEIGMIVLKAFKDIGLKDQLVKEWDMKGKSFLGLMYENIIRENKKWKLEQKFGEGIYV